MRAKKGFTLMELLVSIFITGMVMLALVAMWKTSSSHTSQAQRQAIIKNENTIFLRKLYTDFISASEIICPWGLDYTFNSCTSNIYIAVNNARITKDIESNLFLTRTTGPVCSSQFAEGEDAIYKKCIKPTYAVYVYENDGVYKCNGEFNIDSESIKLDDFYELATTNCNAENKELILPYVSQFSLSIPQEHKESLLVEYTINKIFSGDVPPLYLKFRRYFIKHKGV